MASFDIKDVNKIYGTNHVVKDLNLQVEEGEFLTLLGSSGCGKTTTLQNDRGFLRSRRQVPYEWRGKVLLLDEPLGALDLKLRKQMQLELKRLQYLPQILPEPTV